MRGGTIDEYIARFHPEIQEILEKGKRRRTGYGENPMKENSPQALSSLPKQGIPMKASLILLLLFLLALPLSASALVTQSGGTVTIAQATDDDVFASGGTISVDAPVGSLMAAGGQITVNAPVKGDVIAAGGQITINSDVGGKVVAAGGTVTVNGKVGTNAVLAGGTITLGRTATVGKDAMVSAGTVTNAGNVAGKLTVRSNTFDNTGSAGTLDVELRQRSTLGGALSSIFSILVTIGLLILGIILILIAPGKYRTVEDGITSSPVIAAVIGLVAIFAGIILVILLAITLVGLPIALLLGILILAGLLLSTLFVSSALGKWIGRLLKRTFSDLPAFIIGFIILNILYRIPILGIIILFVAIILGFGALLRVIWQNRDRMGIFSPAPPAAQ